MNQLVDIRALIRSLGKEKTVIFSTHIMQEVQALCDRVVIINDGQLVADDPIDKLQHRLAGETIIHLRLEKEDNASHIFKALDGVSEVNYQGVGSYQIHTPADVDLRSAIFNAVVQHKEVILEMREEKLSVEYIFQKLTKGGADV